MTAPQLPGLETPPELDEVRAWIRELHGPRWRSDPRARWLEAYAVHRIEGTPEPEPVSSEAWRRARARTVRRLIRRAHIDQIMTARAAARALEDSSQ